jgi:hypothetical protein
MQVAPPKPKYGDPDYLETVCRYCGERAGMKVYFKDGTNILVCPGHAREFAHTTTPPWYGVLGEPSYVEGVEKVTLYPDV